MKRMSDPPRRPPSGTLLPLVPLAAGLILLLIALPLAWPAWLMLAAGLCLGFSAGAVTAGRSAARIAVSPAPRSARTAVTPEALTDLELRAKVRGDFTTAGLVDRLQALHDRLGACEAEPADDPLAPQLTGKLRRMYDLSAASLERALALHVGAREMVTSEGRRRVLDQRDALLEEVSTAVGQIEAGIDRLRAAAATAGIAGRHERLADLNTDLDRQLDVARRVEERLEEIESRARGDYSRAAEYVSGR